MKTLRPMTSNILNIATRSPTCRSRVPCLATTPFRPSNHDRYYEQRRGFLSTGPQTITATRTLRYPAKIIYEVISDVSSYSHFVPFCKTSVVTKTSSPASDGKQYPEEAKLTIGFNNNVSEEFWSRVYCVPNKIVEAVSGNTNTTLSSEEIPHHSARPEGGSDPVRNNSVLTHLSTRWSLRPYPYKPPPTSAVHPETTHKNHEETSPVPGQENTEVNLAIEFQFTNPVYATLSQAAAPKVADKMIEAFETRVRAVLEGPANAKR